MPCTPIQRWLIHISSHCAAYVLDHSPKRTLLCTDTQACLSSDTRVKSLTVQNLADTTNGYVHHSIRAFIPQSLPVQVLMSGRRFSQTRLPTVPAVSATFAFPTLGSSRTDASPTRCHLTNNFAHRIDHSNVCSLVHKTLDVWEWKCQVSSIVCRQCHVDVHDKHDCPCRYGQSPPPVRIVVDAE